jgi:hypothetical protein
MEVEAATLAPAEDHVPVAGLERGPGVLTAALLAQGQEQ